MPDPDWRLIRPQDWATWRRLLSQGINFPPPVRRPQLGLPPLSALHVPAAPTMPLPTPPARPTPVPGAMEGLAPIGRFVGEAGREFGRTALGVLRGVRAGQPYQAPEPENFAQVVGRMAAMYVPPGEWDSWLNAIAFAAPPGAVAVGGIEAFIREAKTVARGIKGGLGAVGRAEAQVRPIPSALKAGRRRPIKPPAPGVAPEAVAPGVAKPTLPEGIKKTGLVYVSKDKESLKQLTEIEDGATVKIGNYLIKVKFSEGEKHYDIASLLSTIEDFKTGKVQDVYVRPVFLDKFLSELKEMPKPKPSIAPEAVVAKEPWQMTQRAYQNQELTTLAQKGLSFDATNIKALAKGHKGFVRQALSEGKPIPPEVLADYPELAAQVGKVAPEAVAPLKGPSEAVTGEPITLRVFRGEGRERIGKGYPSDVVGPVLGAGKYYALERDFAAKFGPNVTESTISLRNPLVLRTDEEMRAISIAAGNKQYPFPIDRPAEEARKIITRLRNYIEAQGYDGVIIQGAQAGKNTGLFMTFGDDQIVKFEGAVAPRIVPEAVVPRKPNLINPYDLPPDTRNISTPLSQVTQREIAELDLVASGAKPAATGDLSGRVGDRVFAIFKRNYTAAARERGLLVKEHTDKQGVKTLIVGKTESAISRVAQAPPGSEEMGRALGFVAPEVVPGRAPAVEVAPKPPAEVAPPVKLAPMPEAVPPVEAIPPPARPSLPVTRDQWTYMNVPQRVQAAKAAGLEGRVGSKSWEALSAEEKAALTGQPRIPGVPPRAAVPPPEIPPPGAAPPPPPPPPSENPVDKLIRLVKAAKPARVETEALKHQEMIRRAAIYRDILERYSGKEAFEKARAALKGELPKAAFQPPLEAMSADDLMRLYETVRTTPKIAERLVLQRGNTEVALTKLLGGEMPQRRELELLEQVFGTDLVEAILGKRPFTSKAWEIAVDVLNIPRVLKATIDFSAALRQGVLLSIGQRSEWGHAFLRMFKVAFSEKNYRALDDAIRLDPVFPMAEGSGLYIAPIGRAATLTRLEEQFASRLIKKIPGLGYAVRVSERAYIGFLNSLRFDVFKSYAKLWGETVPADAYSKLAGFINAGTGRGSLGALEEAAPALSGVFFAPRFVVSRIQAPTYLWSSSALVRGVAARNLGSFAAALTAALALAAAMGAKVALDPRSTDWAKIRWRRMRIDLMGGMQPMVRYFTQFVTGQRKSYAGNVAETNRMETLARFGRSKLAPPPGLLVDLLTGETFTGEDFRKQGIPKMVWNQLAPFSIDDTQEAIREQGWLAGLVTAPLVGLGAGIQTYASLAQLEDETAMKLYRKSYSQLNNAQRAKVRESAEIRQGLKEIREGRKLNMREAVSYSFARWEEVRLEQEQALLKTINAGAKGEVLRRAISDFKRERYLATQVLLSEDVLAEAFQNRQQRLEDVLAEAYWSVEAPVHPLSGRPDYDLQEGERGRILGLADQAGVPRMYIIGSGEGTFRGKRYQDPIVRHFVEQYERKQEIIKPYRRLDREFGDTLPEARRAIWLEYIRAVNTDTAKAEALEKRASVRALLTGFARFKLIWRLANPDIEKVLLEEGYVDTPAREQLPLRPPRPPRPPRGR